MIFAGGVVNPPVTANAVTAPSSEGALGRAKFQFADLLTYADMHFEIYLTAAKPFSRSARISSMCSVPMDSRMVLGLMP